MCQVGLLGSTIFIYKEIKRGITWSYLDVSYLAGIRKELDNVCVPTLGSYGQGVDSQVVPKPYTLNPKPPVLVGLGLQQQADNFHVAVARRFPYC